MSTRKCIPQDRELSQSDSTTSRLATRETKSAPQAKTISDDDDYSEEEDCGEADQQSDKDYQFKPTKRASRPSSRRRSNQGQAVKISSRKPSAANNAFRKNRKEKHLEHHEAWKIIRDYEENIASLKRRLNQSTKGRKNEHRMRANVKERMESKSEHAGILQNKGKDLREQRLDAKKKIRDLEKKLRDQDTAIARWQDQTLNKFDARDFPFDTDDVVTPELENLFNNTRTWARKYAVRNWQNVEEQQVESLLKALQDDREPAVASPRALQAIKFGRISPRTVAVTLVNRSLVFSTLARPFSILAGHGVLLGNQGEALTIESVHKSLCQGLPPSSAKFRCLAMMAIKPPEISGLSNIVNSPELDRRIKDHAACVAKATLNHVSPLLEGDDEKFMSARSDLLNYASRFICAAVAIHAQYPYTSFEFYGRLKGESFTVPHALLDPHRAMRLRDAEDGGEGLSAAEAGIVGRSPDLVIQPLVRRSGDERGETWEGQRLILKAIVWVCASDDVREPSKPRSFPSNIYEARKQQSTNALTSGIFKATTTGDDVGEKQNVAQLPENEKAKSPWLDKAQRQNNLVVDVSCSSLYKRKSKADTAPPNKKPRIDTATDRQQQATLGLANSRPTTRQQSLAANNAKKTAHAKITANRAPSSDGVIFISEDGSQAEIEQESQHERDMSSIPAVKNERWTV